MTYHFSLPEDARGLRPIVTPPQGELRLLSVWHLSFECAGERLSFESGESEYGLDILTGTCMAEILAPGGRVTFPRVGGRSLPASGPPSMVYIPRNSEVVVAAEEEKLAALLISAPSRRDTLPRHIPGDEVVAESFGRENWHREVYPSIGPQVDADRLVMGETHTSSGNWSSYPPHKHDQDRPPEEINEEIYSFSFDPDHGFGVQLLWSSFEDTRPPLNEAYIVRNGDTVAIPRGYHPNAVAPGCRMVTIWAYAGERRSWGAWVEDARFSSSQ